MVSNFWANSSKSFINQSKIRENAKKLHFGRWRRKQVKNFIRFNRTKIVKRNCQKAMSRLNVSNTLTGNSVHVPGQPKPRHWTDQNMKSRPSKQLAKRKNSSRFVVSLNTKIFANRGRRMATYHLSFKGQGS